MYPLLLIPPVKDYLWGGRKLKTDYHIKTQAEKAAEAWVLSCHRDGSCTVANGEFSGQSLPEVLEQWGAKALGKKAAAFPYFPLLIKLIDAENRLSVQVHPDDAYALSNEGEYGKTEMWYVVDCAPDAQLIYGMNCEVSREEFARRIEDNTLPEICNFVPVHKGDVFFIAAGTLHAIGEGILIAEVQQNSNTTYRVSDYGRLGADGKPRALHIRQALEVTERGKPSMPYGNVGTVTKTAFGTVRRLAECELFTADAIGLSGTMPLLEENSFVSMLILEGSADVSWDGGSIRAEKGGSVFVPAGFPVTVAGEAQILCSRV